MTQARVNPAHARKGDLTKGSIGRHLVRLSVPMSWGIFAIIAFQLADMFFISLLGTVHLAAVSFTFPITFIVHNLGIAMAIATSSVLARQIGAGNRPRLRRLTTHALVLAVLVGLAVTVIGVALMDPVFAAMGAGEALRPLIRDYMLIWFAGAVFMTVPMVGNAAIRAAGDTLFPALVMSVAALVNLILDPLLIFGLFGFPRLELQGAALATVISYGCAMAAGLYLLGWRRRMVGLYFLKLRLFGDSLKRLLFIAIPAGLTTTLQPLTNAVLVAFLAVYGYEAVAAFGIITRIEAFAFIPIMALATGMAPIIGQNWGAARYDRVYGTLRLAILFCVLWSALVAACLALVGRPLTGLFTAEDAVVDIAMLYILIVMPSLLIGNLVQGWASAFNAMGKPQIAFVMIFGRQIVLTLPLAWLGSHLYGLPGLLCGVALANIVSGAAAHLYSRRLCRRQAGDRKAEPIAA